MNINDKYKQISKYSTGISTKVVASLPVPTESDYNRGYIKRYFVQKTNDNSSPIYEVSNTNFSKYTSSPHFKGVSIKWRISGPTERIFDKVSGTYDNGVSTSNSMAVKIGSEKIKNLKLYLPNLLQFHK